jgi:hypothetical protein
VDAPNVDALIENGATVSKIAIAQAKAKAAWPDFPHNGCAANLSALLQMSGIGVPMILGAGRLAHTMRDKRGWKVIPVGSQIPGDIGVTFDEGGNPGADHIYLVIQANGSDSMMVSDNQAVAPHIRTASGKGGSGGWTPTEYFLRAT